MHMRRRQQPRLDDVDVAGVEGEEAKRAEKQKLKRAYLKVAVNFPCGQDGFQGLQYISRCKCLVFGWCARAWESWIGNEGGEREAHSPFWRVPLLFDLGKDAFGLIVYAVSASWHLSIALDLLFSTHIAGLWHGWSVCTWVKEAR